MKNKYLNKQNVFSETLDSILIIFNEKYHVTVREIARYTSLNEKSLSNWRYGTTLPRYRETRTLLEYLPLLSVLLPIKVSNYKVEEIDIELAELIIAFENLCCERLLDLDSEKLLREAQIANIEELLEGSTGFEYQISNQEPIISDTKIKYFYKNLVFANNLSAVVDGQTFFIPEKQKQDIKIPQEYRKVFSSNFAEIIYVLDILVNEPVEEYENYDFITKNLRPEYKLEFQNFLKSMVDFKPSRNNRSRRAIQSWFAQELNVTSAQISNWKKGEECPTKANLKKLKKLLRFSGNRALVGYKMDAKACCDHFATIFNLSRK